MKIAALVIFISLGIFASEKPNVVIILSDDQGYTDYSFMGHKEIETPNLDKLAKGSVLFRRAYVPTALCRPSLMSLCTGQYASVHKVSGNDPVPMSSENREKLISHIDRFETLGSLLTKNGYVSFQSGKWWEGNFKRGGFTEGMTRGFPEKGGRHGDDGLNIGRQGLKPIEDFLDKTVKDQKPFFIWYAPIMPHTPHTPPKELLDKYLAKNLPEPTARYYAMCEWFDKTCGELVTLLENKKVRDNTLIVYLCDNGWIQNPNNKDQYMPKSKRSPNEGGVRTPIFFNWPAKFKAQDRKELCTSLDILPTIMGALNIKAPENLPGLNLTPFIIEEKEIPRDKLFGETFAHDIKDINDPEKTLMYRWVIKGEWKLLLTYDGEDGRKDVNKKSDAAKPQLYNIIQDPSEEKNLAAENKEKVAELVKELNDWYVPKTAKTIESF